MVWVINGAMDLLLRSTVCAAKEATIGLDSVANDFALTVLTTGRKALNGALERVEGERGPGHDDLKRTFVCIAATVAFSHLVLDKRVCRRDARTMPNAFSTTLGVELTLRRERMRITFCRRVARS
jgi:hypothetical protein